MEQIMNNTQNTKKPFGLSLACKIAAEALHQNIAPASTILGNLLILQTSEYFPKELDINFFSIPKRTLNDSEKRVIVSLLPELKKPSFQIPEILENAVKSGWIKKIPPPTPVAKKQVVKKKKINKPISKAPAVAPVIIVKKNKLT